ncbi:hypothetical protein Metev_1596 [Methanohalobium evestigatum Z-7303]|uniref:Uncharacterized protein n=1 Tax=Methanohalobium evestigatum (strain ATCC BAA-1072 / DSM 3721 / NBRC 107634 / OCM 161 / Z-7303) TaxID=644295 RepID=D7EAS4_METEZ|nr:hypothetical protein [Methanohalobium evestigatum]ADI74441.1 hypothetical protein Metev_1596 [Methanohalobium evestigatum Z-7303]
MERNDKIKHKKAQDLTEDELDELMIQQFKQQIRSDYRRSLGNEHARIKGPLSLKTKNKSFDDSD